MSTIFSLSGILLGGFLYLFVYWKSMKEDYTSKIIFSMGFTTLFCVFVGGIILQFFSSNFSKSRIFNPSEIWFWGSILGFVTAFFINKVRFKISTNEFFEASTPAILSLGVLFTVSKKQLLIATVLFLFIVLFYLLKSKYRTFTWYRSGRVGFAAFSTLTVFFLLRAIIAIFSSSSMLSFVGRIDGLLSASLGFIMFVNVYNLSQRK